MTDTVIVLILFIVCSSLKSLYSYVVMGLGYHLLLIHIISTLGFSTIFALVTIKSRRRIWFATLYMLYAVLLFINTSYLKFYGMFLHVSSAYILLPEILMMIKNLGVPLDIADLIFVVDFPLFLYLLQKQGKIDIPPRYIKITIRAAIGVTALAMVLLNTLPSQFNSQSMAQMEDSHLVSRYGLLGHNLLDLVMPSKGNRVKDVVYGHKVVGYGTSGQRPNIILMQIESLDANIINYRYHGEYVVPFLHKLTRQSLYFPFTLCYRKLGGTSDCEIAVNNGIEPLVDFPLIMDKKYDYPNSVVKVLKKNGYSAEAFHGNTGWYYKRRAAYAAMGYDNFFDPTQMGLAEKGWGVPDHDVMTYVEKHLQKGNTPFFISIITMSSHEPFNNFKHFVPDNRFDGVEPKLTRNYFASIAYTDQAVGEFVANIQKKYPDTYFFLYGDHTPYTINDGSFRRSVLGYGEGMEMVPLFIITPDGLSRSEHDSVASYLDIAPTILHAAGIPYSYRSLGADLLSTVPLHLPVVYRGQPYSRTELFREMSETHKIREVREQ